MIRRVVVVLVALVAVVAAARLIPTGDDYHAELVHAAGLEAGDAVRVAGLTVGRVSDVAAEGDTVRVSFRLDAGAVEDAALTVDTATEVKMLSLLGQRYLSLTPGRGAPLRAGDTIPRSRAQDTYTMERFWLEGVAQVQDLDPAALDDAVDVLTQDLLSGPDELRAALDGVAGVARMVADRDAELERLLSSARAVTRLVLDQTEELDGVLDHGTQLMTMVHERRELLRAMLRDSRRFVVALDELARTTAPELRPTLHHLRTVLRTLNRQEKHLRRTLRLAGPTMRVFTNAAGDGPWLGVNAPYAILPDNLLCALPSGDCE